MIEEGPACGGQFDTMHTTGHQGRAHLVFEIPDLPAERWLCGMQSLFGGNRQAAFLRNCDEVAKMSEFHPMPPKHDEELTKSFSNAPVPRRFASS